MRTIQWVSKYRYAFILFTLTAVLPASCTVNGDHGLFNFDLTEDCVEPAGTITDKTFDTQEFSEISIEERWGNSANIVFDTGSVCRIEVTGPTNALEGLTINYVGERLLLYSSHCFLSDPALKIKITAPVFRRIENLARNVSISGTVKNSETLNLINGSTAYGSFDLNLTAKSLNVNGYNRCTFLLAGTVDKLEVFMKNSAAMQAFELAARDVKVITQTEKDVEVRAAENLNAFIESSGNIYYKGRPAISKIGSGSGKVIDAN